MPSPAAQGGLHSTKSALICLCPGPAWTWCMLTWHAHTIALFLPAKQLLHCPQLPAQPLASRSAQHACNLAAKSCPGPDPHADLAQALQTAAAACIWGLFKNNARCSLSAS